MQGVEMVETYRVTFTKNNRTKSLSIKKYILDYFAVCSGFTTPEALKQVGFLMYQMSNNMDYRKITADSVSSRLLIGLLNGDN